MINSKEAAGNRVLILSVSFFLAACATKLKMDSDIKAVPDDFTQKFDAANVPIYLDPTVSLPTQEYLEPRELLSRLIKRIRPDAKDISLNMPATAVSKGEKAKKKSKGDKSPPPAADVKAAVPAAKTFKPLAWPFGVGEKITLVLRYGPLEGGIAVMEVKEPQSINGETVLHYHAEVKSSKVLELFYKVDDKMDSWVGLKDHLPRRQEIKQLESARWGRRAVVFDQPRHAVRFYAHTTFKEGKVEEIKREDPMTPFAQDVFGALYYYRFLSLGEHRVNFPIHDRFRNWSNELTFIAKEKIIVPAGEFEALRYKMFPRVSGDLAPKGDVEIWVSNDSRRVLLQFKAKIKVGSLTGELKEYEAGKDFQIAPPELKTPFDLPSEDSNKAGQNVQ